MNKIDAIQKLTNSSKSEAYKTMLSFPEKFFCAQSSLTKEKLSDISVLTECTPFELVELIKEFPKLSSINKKQLVDLIKYLQSSLALSDEELHLIFRSQPETILLNKNETKKTISTLQKKYQMSTKEIKQLVVSLPQVLSLGEKQIVLFFDEMYKTKFYKKEDIKNLVITCPDAFFANISKISSNINYLANIFAEKNQKRKILLFRAANKFLILNKEEMLKKLLELDKLNVHLSHLRFYKKVLNENAKITAAKKAMLELYNLDYYLDDVKELSIEQIVSRIVFLEKNNYPIEDIKLTNTMFEAKYKKSQSFLISKNEIYEKINKLQSRLIELDYHDLKLTISNFSNITTPIKLDEILNIIKLDFDRNTKIMLALEIIGIEQNIIKAIINKTPNYISISNIFADICILSQKMTHENVVKTIEKTQNILCSAPNTLSKYLNTQNNIFE